MEAYIVKISDDIAQWHHDLEDALRGEAIPLEEICGTIKKALGENLSEKDKSTIDDIKVNKIANRKSIAELSHIVVNTIVNDLVRTTQKNMNTIEEALTKKFENLTDEEISHKLYTEYEELDLPLAKENIAALSDVIKRERFSDVIRKRVHHSFAVERMNGKGKYIIRKLFEAYYNNPQQLPDGYVLHYMVDIGVFPNADKAKQKGIGFVRTRFDEIIKNMNVVQKLMLMRRICDHIACMTDQYAIEEFRKLYR